MEERGNILMYQTVDGQTVIGVAFFATVQIKDMLKF